MLLGGAETIRLRLKGAVDPKPPRGLAIADPVQHNKRGMLQIRSMDL